MVITVTLNPAVDQTLWVRRLNLGEVNRSSRSQLDPAGKGINVSRMVHRLGWPTIALGFLAGATGHMVQDALDAERVQNHFVWIPGQTRINVTVVDEATATATSLYNPGPSAGAEALASLVEMLDLWLQAGRVLVLAGSLPRGVPDGFYAQCVHSAHQRGVHVIVDADAARLRLAIEAGPDLIKPNLREAEELLGRPLSTSQAIASAARELSSRGVATVVISLGAQGAVCASAGRCWWVRPPRVVARSRVGSGDSLIGGLAVALARGQALQEGLRLGTAAGAATAMVDGTALGTWEQVAKLEPSVLLEEESS